MQLEFALAFRKSRCRFVDALTKTTTTTQAPEIPASTAKVAKAEIKYISDLIQQLIILRQQPQVDEYGTLRLNQQVFNSARELLINAAVELVFNYDGKRMPHGCASTDEQGGLRFEWFRGESSVHLVFPVSHSSRRPYIFHKFGDQHGMEEVSATNLARQLSHIE